MDRRDTIKTLLIGSLSGGALLSGCKPNEVAETVATDSPIQIGLGRTPEELERDQALIAEEFLKAAELSALATLCDIILPATTTAGAASEAQVHEFINFMSKDIPNYKTPIRGGISWLNYESMQRFGGGFNDITEQQRIEIVDDIAYPDKAKAEHSQGVKFFSLVRNLTLTGYYTSEIGIKDLGYSGNMPNIWDGVPQDVLDKHGMAYEEEWLAKCVDQSKRNVIAEWDAEMNLLT